jgi:hypothetical protein
MNKLLKNLLVLGLAITALFNTLGINAQGTQIPPYPTTAIVKSLTSINGTDVYNGLRGQSFNEGWKFYKVIVDCGGYEQTHLNWIRLRQTGRERCDKSGKRQKLLWHRFLSHQLALPQRHLFFGC